MKFGAILVLVSVSLLVSAFGGGGGGLPPAPTSSPTPTVTMTPTSTPVPTPTLEERLSLKCADKPTVRERVACRLELTEYSEGATRLVYLPEQCLTLNGTPREGCIKFYDDIQKCRFLPTDSSRESCVKRELKLSTFEEEKATCNALSGENRSGCMNDYRSKINHLVVFRFYNLEEKAERLSKLGASEDLVIDFVTFIEVNKQVFDFAPLEDKLRIVREVAAEWNSFKIKAIQQIREKRRA